MSTAHPAPAAPSLGREMLEAFCTLLVGPLLQLGRCLALLFLWMRRGWARSDYTARAVGLGRSLQRLGVGDEMLRQRAAHLAAERAPQAQLDAVLGELGRSGLETSVPLPGVEVETQEAHRAAREVRASEAAYAETARLIWPGGTIGWAALLCSYLLWACALLLLWAYLVPAYAPAALARLVGKGPKEDEGPVPSATSGDITIRVKSAVIGRHVVHQGDKVKLVTGEQLTLRLVLSLTNEGKSSVSYTSLRGKFQALQDEGARAVDNQGISLRRIVFKNDAAPEGGVQDAEIAPGETVEDVLLFGPPDPGFKSFDLFLPTSNFEQSGDAVRLTVPAPFVEKPDSYTR